MREIDRFQVAVSYLTEYTGVRGAVIADHEGLVVAHSPEAGFDGELYAAAGLELVKTVDAKLDRLIKPGCKYLSVKTDNDWITIAHTLMFCLIVAADRKADDLLTVRISRALDMITDHVKYKYPALMLAGEPMGIRLKKEMEATNV